MEQGWEVEVRTSETKEVEGVTEETETKEVEGVTEETEAKGVEVTEETEVK